MKNLKSNENSERSKAEGHPPTINEAHERPTAKPKEDQREEFNPLKSIDHGVKNRSVITDITDITDRKSRSFYISKRIAASFATYSKFTGRPLYWCVEEALIEYMQNHPIPQVSLTVTQDFQSFLPDLATRLKTKLLKDQLSKTLGVVKRVAPNPSIAEDIKSKLKNQLIAIVTKALKVQPPDRELLELLREVEEWI